MLTAIHLELSITTDVKHTQSFNLFRQEKKNETHTNDAKHSATQQQKWQRKKSAQKMDFIYIHCTPSSKSNKMRIFIGYIQKTSIMQLYHALLSVWCRFQCDAVAVWHLCRVSFFFNFSRTKSFISKYCRYLLCIKFERILQENRINEKVLNEISLNKIQRFGVKLFIVVIRFQKFQFFNDTWNNLHFTLSLAV